MTDKIREATKDEQVERLAEAVHDRWQRTKRAAGFHGPFEGCEREALDLYANCSPPPKRQCGDKSSYVYYPEHRCAEGFLHRSHGATREVVLRCDRFHADLIPYSELAEDKKEIDRETVRAVLEAQ